MRDCSGPGRDSGIKHSTLPSSSHDDPSERRQRGENTMRRFLDRGRLDREIAQLARRPSADAENPGALIGGASPVATARASIACSASSSSKHAQIIRRAVNFCGPSPVNDIPARANPLTARALPSMQICPAIRPNATLDDRAILRSAGRRQNPVEVELAAARDRFRNACPLPCRRRAGPKPARVRCLDMR